ncbi:MAG: hypothetical protein JXA61_07820 [Bacteroidales bacterium]|nr:hypothetical protein [Bacteroidales bacterium]
MMKNSIWQKLQESPNKGGLIGAIAGVLISLFYHRREDEVARNAGKTALFSGAGFMLGEWLQKMIKKQTAGRQH